MPEPKYTRQYITRWMVTPEMAAALDAYIERNGLSKTDMLRIAAMRLLEEENHSEIPNS